ncbi:M56 family metallopeptidase [Flavobacterium macrobrachii]|jgi:beta-lactamase regulating signal transducer with metallopeptidase domain|uniref:M56 family metallopeptidase n=1 Tax=Flavobacterium macrobrachii TaxID=591204 RepID=UPI0037C0A0DE
METIFIYLLKSSGLIAMFYLAYYFLLRKETFFDSNRWFLLSGLITSLLLPLYFIKKVVYVERPKYTMEDLIAFSNQNPVTVNEISAVEAFDWMQLVWVSYIIIASFLVIKIIMNFISLYRMLFQQQIIKKEQFKLVNLNQNIAPFSFFNYIVINPDLYTNEELQSILLHEKIHSQEKHSIDVLVAKLFCVVFWFNPFVWLYKKAILQNLEYIADQKAMQQIEDKKSYQLALLKVVINQNCLSITNNFYQSLIKKRIVMLNKNQSQKRNSLKYVLIIPALIGFILLFQIQTIAQEKNSVVAFASPINEVKVKIDKNSSDEKLKQEAKRLKEEHGITLKCSKVKRNAKGEITEIKVEYKDKNGNKVTSHIKGDEPIEPFVFFKTDNNLLGFSKAKTNSIITKNGSITLNGNNLESLKALSQLDSIKHSDIAHGIEIDEDFDFDMDNHTVTITSGNNPQVIVNGKVITDNKAIANLMNMNFAEVEKALAEADKSLSMSYSYSSDDDDDEITINGKKLSDYISSAVSDARVQVNKMKPEMREKVKKEIERSRIQIAKSHEDIAKSREDVLKAREEMVKARIETREAIKNAAASHSDKTKSEIDKVRAEIEKVKQEMAKAKEELAKERAKQNR